MIRPLLRILAILLVVVTVVAAVVAHMYDNQIFVGRLMITTFPDGLEGDWMASPSRPWFDWSTFFASGSVDPTHKTWWWPDGGFGHMKFLFVPW